MGMTLSAVVASSLLSASLAFFAGQTALPSQLTTTTITPTTPPIISTTIVRPPPSQQASTPAILGSGMKYERTVPQTGSVKVVTWNIPEQRASQELRVCSDKNGNSRDGGSSWDTTRPRVDRADSARVSTTGCGRSRGRRRGRVEKSPITACERAEVTAREELQIGVDMRRIARREESLAQEKATLKELQQTEERGKLP